MALIKWLWVSFSLWIYLQGPWIHILDYACPTNKHLQQSDLRWSSAMSGCRRCRYASLCLGLLPYSAARSMIEELSYVKWNSSPYYPPEIHTEVEEPCKSWRAQPPYGGLAIFIVHVLYNCQCLPTHHETFSLKLYSIYVLQRICGVTSSSALGRWVLCEKKGYWDKETWKVKIQDAPIFQYI